MDSDATQAVADYVAQTLGKENYQFICAVVANCKMLAFLYGVIEHLSEATPV